MVIGAVGDFLGPHKAVTTALGHKHERLSRNRRHNPWCFSRKRSRVLDTNRKSTFASYDFNTINYAETGRILEYFKKTCVRLSFLLSKTIFFFFKNHSFP